MKKTFAMLLVLVFALFSLAFAEEPVLIDLSSLTDEELLSLNEQIKNELGARELVGGILEDEGTYLIGSDVPVGSYDIICISTVDGEEAITIEFFFADDGDFIEQFDIGLGTTRHLFVRDGQYFKVRNGRAAIVPSVTIPAS